MTDLGKRYLRLLFGLAVGGLAYGRALAQSQQEAHITPVARWGEKPNRVKEQLAEALISNGVNGEVLIRAQTTLLGEYPAGALYCFHPILGLSNVVLAVRPEQLGRAPGS